MARFEEVTAAVSMSEAEVKRRLERDDEVSARAEPVHRLRPVAHWVLDAQTGRPVCRWTLA
jgi:hypothetical protein